MKKAQEDYPHMGPTEDLQEESGEFEDDQPKRRTYIVDKQFQYRFALTWMVMTGIYLLIIFGSFLYTTYVVSGQVHTPELQQQMVKFLKYTGVSISFVSVFFILYFLLLSHRIAGPAYHLRQSMDRIADGDIQFSVHLREKDYLKNVADSLNDLLDELKQRNQQIINLQERFVTLRNRFEETGVNEEDLEELDELLVELKKIQPHNPPQNEQDEDRQ
jgi:sensor histidine kinase YesM